MAEEETEHGELRSLPTTTGGGLAGHCWVPVGLTWTPRTRPRPHRARSGGRALGRQSPRRRRRVARTEALSQLRGWGEAPRPIAGRRASSRAGSASDWSSTATPQPGGGAAGWQEAWTAGIDPPWGPPHPLPHSQPSAPDPALQLHGCKRRGRELPWELQLARAKVHPCVKPPCCPLCSHP